MRSVPPRSSKRLWASPIFIHRDFYQRQSFVRVIDSAADEPRDLVGFVGAGHDERAWRRLFVAFALAAVEERRRVEAQAFGDAGLFSEAMLGAVGEPHTVIRPQLLRHEQRVARRRRCRPIFASEDHDTRSGSDRQGDKNPQRFRIALNGESDGGAAGDRKHGIKLEEIAHTLFRRDHDDDPEDRGVNDPEPRAGRALPAATKDIKSDGRERQPRPVALEDFYKVIIERVTGLRRTEERAPELLQEISLRKAALPLKAR